MKTTPRSKTKQLSETARLRRTAYHEAGHVVAAWKQRLPFRSASIIPDETSLGRIVTALPKWFDPELGESPRHRLLAEKHIIVNFAGAIAEGRHTRSRIQFGMESDDRCSIELGMAFCGTRRTTEAYLHYLWSMSRDIIKVNWWAVVPVAQLLMAKRKVTRAEALATISDAMLRRAGAPPPIG